MMVFESRSCLRRCAGRGHRDTADALGYGPGPVPPATKLYGAIDHPLRRFGRKQLRHRASAPQ